MSLFAWLSAAMSAPAQEPPGETPSGGADEVTAAPIAQLPRRLGYLHLRPFYLTPYIRVGSLGFDTNVFYTPTDRQSDFTISGGPGLEVVLPFRSAARLTVDSFLSYRYFARTESQRRLNGGIHGRLEYDPYVFDEQYALSPGDFRPPSRASVEQSIMWSNDRYSLEVDERVPRRVEGTRVHLFRPLLGRMGIELRGARSQTRVLEESQFYGVDLQRTLGQNDYLAGGGLRHYLTIKTSLVATVDFTFSRFPFDETRDADGIAVRGGVETDSTALIAGYARVGYRWFRPLSPLLPERRVTEYEADGMWNASPRTQLGGGVRRSLSYSALAASGTLPTLLNEQVEARINKQLWGPLGIRLFGRRIHFTSDSEVVLETPSGPKTAPRDDVAWEAGANLGWNFGPRVRVGVQGTYTDRRSNFSDFGLEGLLIGLTVDVLTPLSESLDPRRRY